MAKGSNSMAKKKDLLTLDEASERLGLTADFLRWALENDLLKGVRQDDGVWGIPGQELEAGFNAIEEELAKRCSPDPRSKPASGQEKSKAAKDPRNQRQEPDVDLAGIQKTVLPSEPAAGLGRTDVTGQSARDADLLSEVARMRTILEDLERQLADKDALIADLARSLARLGEAAMTRIPNSSD